MRFPSIQPPRFVRRSAEWLPALLLTPLLVLLWVTVLGRVATPLELEWNEGQTAEQAWRFAEGLGLYPPPTEGWVPYMYAPGYHLVLGAMFRLSDSPSLALGRLISVLAMAATQWAIFQVVFDRTRRAAPAVMAVGLTAMWYKASGFTWDLVRVDALALAFASWGLVLLAHPRRTGWRVFGGLLLMALATLTKQTFGLLGVVACLQLVVLRPRITLLAGAVVTFLTINACYIFWQSGNPWFLKYTVINASNHLSRSDLFYPGYVSPMVFREFLPENGGVWDWVRTYAGRWSEAGAPAVWNEWLRHWMIVAGLLGWFIAESVVRRRGAGVWFLIPSLIALAFGSVSSWGKFGGYVNNFLPFYAGLAIVLGVATNWLCRRRSGWARVAPPVVLSALIVLQFLQPWRLVSLGEQATPYRLSYPESDPKVESWMVRQGQRLAGAELPDDAPWWISWRYRLAHWEDSGLLWIPDRQWPSDDSAVAYAALLDWLEERRTRRESVWILHHHWYALAAGHPAALNVDMVRCAIWAGDNTPPGMLDTLARGEFSWLVMDIEDIGHEWLPAGTRDKIMAAYEFVGPVPGLEEFRGTKALMPVTGAKMRPLYLWRSRTIALHSGPDPG